MKEKKNPKTLKIYICGGGGGERDRERIMHRMGEGIKKRQNKCK